MRYERHVVGRKSQWLVAFPAGVRRHLGLSAGMAVYWHVVSRGQVTLTVTGHVRGGRPRAGADCPNCTAKDREIARLHARNEARDRFMYAEGHSTGSLVTYERLMNPHGPSAQAARTRLLRFKVLPDSARSRKRREQRARARAKESPAPAPSPSSESERGAGT